MPGPKPRRGIVFLAVSIAVVLALFAGSVGAGAAIGNRRRAAARLAASVTSTTEATTTEVTEGASGEGVAADTTVPPETTTEATEPPTTSPPAAVVTPTTAKAKAAVATTLAPSARAGVFGGLGAWVDVFDWAPSYDRNGGAPTLAPETATRAMAAQGVQVLFIQTARADNPTGADLVDEPTLRLWVDHAVKNGMRVISWYLPTFEDVAKDLRLSVASAKYAGIAGFSLDIESTKVADDAERSRRLVQLTASLRAALPNTPISACTLPNVVTDVINGNYWSDFPWKAIASAYDAWQPMDYWTNRTEASGYRDANRYTAENIDRMRAKLGLPNAVVSPVGGIGDKTTAADIAGFVAACKPRGCIGGSLYDWSTQQPDSYAGMKAFRR